MNLEKFICHKSFGELFGPCSRLTEFVRQATFHVIPPWWDLFIIKHSAYFEQDASSMTR
jgi:hypothetical protein